MEMDIEHFSHEHPLILKEKQTDDSNWEIENCAGCSEIVVLGGTSYSCNINGCNFTLHKNCAKLPRGMHHPMHTDHILTLHAKSPYGDQGGYCDNCKVDLNNFTYHCSVCNFDLDVVCALPLDHIESENHKHPLISMLRPASLLCDACGEENKGIFYTCYTCIDSGIPFYIHRNCLLLPTTLKHSGHDHRLKLAYSYPTEYFSTRLLKCEICSERLNRKCWVYLCGDCRFFSHVNCATQKSKLKKETTKMEPFMLILEPSSETDPEVTNLDRDVIRLPVADESLSLVSHFLKEMRLGENKRDKTTELDHCHEHPLIFFEDQSKNVSCSGIKLSLMKETPSSKICRGCEEPISNAPFYGCAQCNIYIHRDCVELPSEVIHPWHPQHPLIFLTKAPTSSEMFICEYCRCPCVGFAYHCAICEFSVDVKCGLLPGAIKHEAHTQHEFVLREGSINDRCNACGRKCYPGLVFKCNICNIYMHVVCAKLPSMIRHRYDKHPFILTYSPLKNHPSEYICELCEKEIDPKLWFYHCIDCDQSTHLFCSVVGNPFSNLRYIDTFTGNSHPHPLNFVINDKKKSPCDSCGQIKCRYVSVFGSNPAFECSRCNFKIHLKCAGF